MASTSRLCVIIGVGLGNGAALVGKFAQEGYRVAMIARSRAVMGELETLFADCHGYICDASDPEALTACLYEIAVAHGPADVLVYNAGKGVWGDALAVAPDEFEGAWRINTLGGYAAARAVLPGMVERGSGAIVYIGATASRRGGAKSVAFAAAKAAQRSVAESLARAYGPAGVHVALIVVDGIVAEPLMLERFKDKPRDFFVEPLDIADMALMLVRQPRSTWSFELEARPFAEPW